MNGFFSNLLFVGVLTVACSIGLGGTSFYREGISKSSFIQGVVAVLGGVVVIVSLTLPWITYEGNSFIGIKVGQFFYSQTSLSVVSSAIYFLLFLSFLVILGGFLRLARITEGKRLVSPCSKLVLILTVAFIVTFSLWGGLRTEIWEWLSVFGGILGVISKRLYFPQPEKSQGKEEV
ncbi:hypothetical protein AKJ51_00465 [candidate division MSBL1 archaeon SCGC-AAA382A20]|uniref:Uncharacterized protein n=1 Tax=candidate division MSBL1 archaeon SCGC-AAA382A20 TaxID=1698280 RepID=A0A133VMG0_9EURY|nr:hypothetical protein AKJ51_00465 [candidate division MSBL1 archaeon SCGC-AAA382A20]